MRDADVAHGDQSVWVGVVVAFFLIALAGAVLLHRTAQEEAPVRSAPRPLTIVDDRGHMPNAVAHAADQMDTVAFSLE